MHDCTVIDSVLDCNAHNMKRAHALNQYTEHVYIRLNMYSKEHESIFDKLNWHNL